MNFQKFKKNAHRRDAEGAKEKQIKVKVEVEKGWVGWSQPQPLPLKFFVFFSPLWWAFLFLLHLTGALWLGGCAGTRESVPGFVEGVRVRVLLDPSAAGEVEKIPVRFTAFPEGLRTAVCFGWDVKGAEALELAGLLEQYGWRGTLFFPYKLEGETGSAVADDILQVEIRGVEVGCRATAGQMADVVRCAAEGKAFWDAFVGRPVISFGAVEAAAREDLDRLANMGYLSLRSGNRVIVLGTLRKEQIVMPRHFLFDRREDLARRWMKVREQEGGIFYVWGRSCGSDADNPSWEALESLLAEYGRMEDVWYCTQGEWAAYVSARDASRIVRLTGEKNELCLSIEAGRSAPKTWCPALTVEVQARPSSVVMVLVEDQPVPFEVRGDRVLFEVEPTR